MAPLNVCCPVVGASKLRGCASSVPVVPLELKAAISKPSTEKVPSDPLTRCVAVSGVNVLLVRREPPAVMVTAISAHVDDGVHVTVNDWANVRDPLTVPANGTGSAFLAGFEAPLEDVVFFLSINPPLP
ncbi:hypothetical protein ACSRUE_17730 [Sorangium sp. KYC3313]|uniref:hypothetical protein n=1 Tax=Sorangium sp. KYC3313 TaxID=3449740 RepID=UPI003F893CDF